MTHGELKALQVSIVDGFERLDLLQAAALVANAAVGSGPGEGRYELVAVKPLLPFLRAVNCPVKSSYRRSCHLLNYGFELFTRQVFDHRPMKLTEVAIGFPD